MKSLKLNKKTLRNLTGTEAAAVGGGGWENDTFDTTGANPNSDFGCGPTRTIPCVTVYCETQQTCNCDTRDYSRGATCTK